jgi:hypothetical protein
MEFYTYVVFDLREWNREEIKIRKLINEFKLNFSLNLFIDFHVFLSSLFISVKSNTILKWINEVTKHWNLISVYIIWCHIIGDTSSRNKNTSFVYSNLIS